MEKIKRDTNEDLMNNVFELVKNCHCYDKAEQIMDYFHAESFMTMDLSDYEFDFDANVRFGANEGIYIDCSIRGHFDENESSDKKQILHCGTFKTLGTSLEDMRIMGELAGSLTYFAREYVNKNLDKYTPTKTNLNRCIYEPQSTVQKMTYDRAMCLLSEIVEHTCVAKKTNEAIEHLFRLGFTDDELVDVFNFSKNDVAEVVRKIEEET